MIFVFYILIGLVALVLLFVFIQGYIILFKRKPFVLTIATTVSILLWLIPNYTIAGIIFFAFNCFVTAYAKMIDRKHLA